MKKIDKQKLIKLIKGEIRTAILNLELVPSMRLLMTAGKACDVDNISAYNCAYIAIDNKRAFSETLYILMNGTGVGFSCERDYISKLPILPEELVECDDVIVVGDSKRGWAKAFKKLLSSLWEGDIPNFDFSRVRPAGERLRTFGGRACLTPDTVVYKDRKKTRGYNEITIGDLYDLQNSQGKWKNVPNHFKDIKLRSLDEESGEFYRNNILEVIDNGTSPVYEILTENRYCIKATSNHRFMSSTGGYQALANFKVGERIAVNGSKELKTGICIDCSIPISRRAERCRDCNDISQIKTDALFNTARARKACRLALKKNCEVCNKDKLLLVHHIDEDPRNNSEDNLQTLCEGCHHKHHAGVRTFGDPYAHKYVSYDTITSIKYKGLERVYDLSMETPNHNFVANGFISHNSGPQPLMNLFSFCIEIFKGGCGRRLTSIEVHDIICMIGDIVVVGGVRRSALISLSNLTDIRMREAKTGNWHYKIEDGGKPWRALANNSVSYTEKPDVKTFMEEWLSLVKSGSGERGIFNRVAAQNQAARWGRRDRGLDYGCNPCSEIILRNKQFCNLTEVVVRAEDTFKQLKRKVELATILGTYQATLSDFHFLSEEWKKNTEEERLLGVSLTGIMDNEELNGTHSITQLEVLLEDLRDAARKTNEKYSEQFGIKPSTAITCVKPSGTVSQLVDSASGIHTRYAPYYIRRIQLDKKDPVCSYLVEKGFPLVDYEAKKETHMVASFPMQAPKGGLVIGDLSSIEQLEIWLTYQEHWCEHKPSCTVYVKEEEWFEVGAWVYEHFEKVSGVSFLPYSDHIYVQPPYTPITEEEYEVALAAMPKGIDWTDMIEEKDNTDGSQELACAGPGGCEL